MFALLLMPAFAQTGAPLNVTLTVHEYPPFIGRDLPYGGLLTRIVVEAFKAANVNVQLEQVSSNRAITGVMMGMYDGAFGWAHTPERERKLLYSKSSIYTFRMVFFQRRSMEVNWNTLADLKPYQIGTTLGDHYSEELTELHARHVLQVQEAASDLNNMRKLLLGRIDLFPIEEEAGKALIQTMLTPREQSRLSYQARPLATVPTYLVLRRDLPRAQELLDRFDQGFRQLSESGQLAHILAEAHRSNMGLVQQASQKDTVH
jgi:polar amino acid transport system substrate-binding protein